VENPQKHSDLKGQSEFTTTGVLVMRNNMLHLCDTPTTKTKLLSGKDTKSQSTSSSTKRYREQREIDEYGSSIPTKPHEYMSDEDTSSNSGNGFENLAWD
jgi:hypothetical protein